MIIVLLFVYAPLFYIFWIIFNYIAKKTFGESYIKQYAIIAFIILCPLLLIAFSFLFMLILALLGVEDAFPS